MSYTSEINGNYSIIPNDGETQYESYQSIFAKIMNLSDGSPYKEICKIDNIKIVPDCAAQRRHGTTQTKILYLEGKGHAHFKGFVKGETMDPYDYYQLKNSEGFCQMFAYFITCNNTKDFIKINQAPLFNTAYEMDITKQKIIADLAINTQKCCKKSIDLLNSLKYNRAKEFFDKNFQELKTARTHGIPIELTLDKYLKEFEEINSKSINIEAYIIENYERIYNDVTKHKDIDYLSLEDMGIILQEKVIHKKSKSVKKGRSVKGVKSQSINSLFSDIKKTIKKRSKNNVNSHASKKKRKRKRKI